jgi:hypothetical protein
LRVDSFFFGGSTPEELSAKRKRTIRIRRRAGSERRERERGRGSETERDREREGHRTVLLLRDGENFSGFERVLCGRELAVSEAEGPSLG